MSFILTFVGIYGILGYALENIYENGFNQLVLEKIAKPLGMERTQLNYPSYPDENLAFGYVGMKQINWHRNDSCVINSAGGLRSCIKDLRIYAKAQAGIIETPLQLAIQKTQEIQFLGPDSPIGRAYICLGWGKTHNGNYEHFGGTPGFCSFVGFNHETKRTVVVLTNTGYSQLCTPWIMTFGNYLMDNN